MRTLNNIRYLLFAVIVFGCFANFAQNAYGLDMFYFANLFIAIIFFIEAITSLSREFANGKARAFYLFTEHFFIGLMFLGNFFKYMHWPGAGALLALGSLFLGIQYLIFATVKLVKDFNKGKALSLIVFFFYLATVAAVEGLIFKTMHWPGASTMMNVSVIIGVLFITVGIIKRKYSYNGQEITLYKKLMSLPGKPVMTFTYNVIWVIYISLIILNVAPDFYFLHRPPAFEELVQKKEDERAGIYWDYYEPFLEQREAEK